MSAIWIFYALLYGLFRAVYVKTSAHFKIRRWQTAFLRALFGLLVLLPFYSYMEWPDSMRFYYAAFGVSVVFTVGMLIQMILSSEKEGRVSAVYMPVEAILAGIIWAIVYPPVMNAYMQSGIYTVGLVAAFVVASIGILKIRSHDTTVKTSVVVLSVGLTYALAGIVTKIVLMDAVLPGKALSFVAINFFVMTAIFGVASLVKSDEHPGMMTGKMVKSGLVMGVVTVLAFTSFVMGIAYAPNPGYIGLFAMALPVWLSLWHRYRGIKDNANGFAVAMILAGIVLLVITAAQIH